MAVMAGTPKIMDNRGMVRGKEKGIPLFGKSAACCPSHDILKYDRRPLEAIFHPRSVAVVGATETKGSVGLALIQNLKKGGAGGIPLFPVNPKRPKVLGIKAYPRVAEIGKPVDLAVIATPARTVPGVVRECVDAGVKAAVVISAGFKEVGPEGVELEHQVLEEAKRGRLRIVGPNCLGVMNPHTGLNATFAHTIAREGSVGFLSQSGALGTAILDWSLKEKVGFSAFASLGSMADVGWGELITYLGNDPLTKSIVIYMESIGDARAFLSAAREVALTKPLIVLKAGRTEAAAKAAASHTGTLAGSDDVLDAAFRRCGVLRVQSISELFHMAEVLSKQPRPQGPRLAIITNAGGPGVLAADALLEHGGSLAPLDPGTLETLNQVLPAAWSHNNPIDVLGDADPERYSQALSVTAQDPNTDGMLVILTPQAMTDPKGTAQILKKTKLTPGKPVLASWMGGDLVAPAISVLNSAGIPTLSYPDTAARTFADMWRHGQNLKSLYETPSATELEDGSLDRAKAARILQEVRSSGRTLLTEPESKNLLGCYGIPAVPTLIAKSAEEAVALAEQIGFPIVLKLYSETLTHKTDVGGVKLDLKNAEAVRVAYREIESSVRQKAGAEHFLGVTVQPMVSRKGWELILGSSVDAQFGPVILFGSGGTLVEIFKDRSLGLPPLNTTLARRLMEQTKIYKALQGARGQEPVDMGKLEAILVRFSRLVAEHPRIKELDINPLLVSGSETTALDARVVLHGNDVSDLELPRPAIRPYPDQYASDWTMKNGEKVLIRPIRPEDEPALVRFHETLSDQSVYLRYFHAMKLQSRTAHERLARICFVDYDREIVLVVERKSEKGEPKILAVARLSKAHEAPEAEFSMLVSDRFQGQGLGSELLKRLVAVAREEGLERITAITLAENRVLVEMSRKLGFSWRAASDPQRVIGELKLGGISSGAVSPVF